MQSSYVTLPCANPPFHLLLYVACMHCLQASTFSNGHAERLPLNSVCRILCIVWGLLGRGRAALARLYSSGISVPAELPETADILHQVSAAIQRSHCVLSRHHPQHRSPNYQCDRFSCMPCTEEGSGRIFLHARRQQEVAALTACGHTCSAALIINAFQRYPPMAWDCAAAQVCNSLVHLH